MHRPQQRGGSGTSAWKELQLALLVPQCISLKFELLKIGERHEEQGERRSENDTLKSEDEGP